VRYSVTVEVSLRPGIADPEGATIERALPALGITGVSAVRAGKCFWCVVEASSEDDAHAQALAFANRLLANPVIEEAVARVVPA
jgi:phosphoribosylformylglycinamidine synthase subunit PurS